jgi:hypothetical protein
MPPSVGISDFGVKAGLTGREPENKAEEIYHSPCSCFAQVPIHIVQVSCIWTSLTFAIRDGFDPPDTITTQHSLRRVGKQKSTFRPGQFRGKS